MNLHLDLQADDRLFWFTTTGWMMWNFLVGGLTTDASIVLYDGSPAARDGGALWDLAEAAGITCFGTGAAFIGSCQKAGLRPAETRDLSAIRSVGSTGSPLSPEGFSWVYEALGDDIWLFSTSGGTDVCTAFVGGVPTLPVYRGELQARALGVRVESWSPAGEPLVGEVGELVVVEPMPSMPLFFWGDADGSRYRESYFEMFPGVWRHGDWIEITDRGTAVISGRSDATINRGGVRMGTSEIYRAVLGLDEVVDALVLDLPLPGTDGYMPLFVVLREGVALDDELVARITNRIREECSPRHVPDSVEQIAEVPRTLSGKVLELPVKRILLGADAETTVSRDALATPAALDAVRGDGPQAAVFPPRLACANIVVTNSDPDQQRTEREMKARLLAEENRKWWTLVSVSFALFMIMLDNTVVNVALPTIQRDLGIDVAELEWVVTGYALSFAVLMLSGGQGRRHVRPAAYLHGRARDLHRRVASLRPRRARPSC